MKRLVQGLFILLLIVLAIPVLIVEGEIGVWVAPIFPSQELVYHYVHSVEQTAVYERFKIGYRELTLTQTRYQSYGAGLPLEAEGFRQEEGWFVLDINRRLSQLVVRVSSVPGQSLQLGSEHRLLTSFGEVGRPVSIAVKPVFQWLISGKFFN